METWFVPYMAQQHDQQLAEEACRERLTRAANSSQILHTLSHWWESLTANRALREITPEPGELRVRVSRGAKPAARC